jgi:succinate dehydrogenase/fumarate reductase-like Fe-S protein
MTSESKTVTVNVCAWSENGGGAPKAYTLPLEGAMDVLNALEYIHTHLDPSVSYRSSCRRGVCGACVMRIDGVRRLACETEVRDGMTIDPYSRE